MADPNPNLPEYIYRPAIYFHAMDDAQAKSFTARMRAAIEDEVTGPARYAYDQVWHEEKTLVERTAGPGPAGERVV